MRNTLFLVVGLAFLPACTVQIAGTDSTITIDGTVQSQGQPIAGATVNALDQSVTTSSSGAFSLEVKPSEDRVTVEIEADGFAPARRVVTRRPEVFHYHSDIELFVPTRRTMLGSGVMDSFTVSAGGQDVGISVPEGTLPPGTTLEITAFPAESGPGTMETTEGTDKLLQTGGMLYIRAVDSAGKEVPVGGNGIQVTPGNMPDIGMTGATQAYQLDNRAVWAPQTTSGGLMGKVLSAREAGFWNCDRNYRTACVKGVIKSPGKRCGGQRVRAGGDSGLFSQDSSGANGEFCVEGPSTLSRSLSVGSSTQMIRFPSNPGSCRTDLAACDDIGEVTVKDDDCPGSCAADEVDTPTGCEKVETMNTGGGSGGNQNAAGFTCLGTQQCSTWNSGQRCNWRTCACADAAGGQTCVRAWYEASTGQVFACGQCTASCTSAAQSLIAACN